MAPMNETSRPLNGKCALITGSSAGLGYAIAEGLAAAGCNVALHGLEGEAAVAPQRQALQDRQGVRVAYVRADLSREQGARDLVQGVEAVLGAVDILVNNAGIQHVAPIDEFPVDKWNAIIAINLSSAFHVIRAALPKMKAKKWGRIISTASAHALVASPYKSAYVAAKHGIAGLTKTVALEVATMGITVNAICPGYVWTPLVEKQIPDTMKARGLTAQQVKNDVILAAQPTKQFVTTEEVAALAVFLCTDGAKSITGALLPMDGGWTAA